MEKKRRFIEDNKGYSLVELIIVIAIIVVLSAAAYATLTIMHSAKAKEAASTFESEISELITKSKGQMCVVKDEDGDGIDDLKPDYRYCINVYKDSDGKFYLRKGYWDSVTDAYTFPIELNNSSGKGTSLSAYVIVKYKALGGTENTVDASGISIVYDRSGMCIEGAGEFSFYKKSGSYISSVTLNKNGSHQSN